MIQTEMRASYNRIALLGCPLDPLTMNATLAIIAQRIESRKSTRHMAINVSKILMMQNDSRLRHAIESADIINADGKGLVWGGRFCGLNIPERVAGIDLFHRLIALSEERNYAVYFLGAREGVIRQVITRIKRLHPRLRIAGYHHGYFWDDEKRVVDEIAASGARLLFVAISSPRKEIFIHKWENFLNVDFIMGVGGTFDIVSGRLNRAPVWIQTMGLEWLFRLVQEPRRLWRRYLIGNSVFLLALLKARFSKPKPFSDR